jgi:hypothetical protein
MCFVCYAFDVAPKEVVWYCKRRHAGRPGVPGTPEAIWNLKTCLHTERCFHWTASCTAKYGATAHTARIALQVLMALFPARLFLTFSFHWQHLVCLLTWSCSTSLLPLGLCQEHTHPAKLVASNSKFRSIVKASLNKCYNMWHLQNATCRL